MSDRHENDRELEESEIDRFDAGMARTASEMYNAPPEVPRDEMWTVIQAARAARAPAARESAEGATVTPIHRFRPRPWWVAVAAALAIGVVLGRGSIGMGPDSGTTLAESGSEAPASVERATPGSTPGAVAEVPRSYRVAAARHLNRTADFLTMFRVDARSERSEQVDTDLGTWARRLLTDTRLLLDSPAGNDPELRVLLSDLELVLAQIVQLRAGDEQDVEIIDEGLESSQLLFRLKAAQATAPATVGL
jgi:hypothetical protein